MDKVTNRNLLPSRRDRTTSKRHLGKCHPAFFSGQIFIVPQTTTQAHGGGRRSAHPPRNRTISIPMNTLPAGSGTITPAHVGSNGSAPPQSDRTIGIPMDTLPAGSGTTTQAHVNGNGFAPPSPLEEDVASISTIISLYSGSGTGSSMV
jgi:hypothetical protein